MRCIQRRINIRKILSLDDIINKPYSKVTIELKKIAILMKLRTFKNEGQTKISLIINNKNKKIHYNLQIPRKFDFNQLKIEKQGICKKNNCLEG